MRYAACIAWEFRKVETLLERMTRPLCVMQYAPSLNASLAA